MGKHRDLKDECCEKFLRKGKACKTCPLMSPLAKADRKRLIAQRQVEAALRALADPTLLPALLAKGSKKKKSHLDALFDG